MATSSKVRFDLEKLRMEAMKSLGMRIEHARLEVDSYLDDAALAVRVVEWRERQIQKINAIAAQLSENESAVDNHRLSRFALDPIPEVDRWDRKKAEDRLHNLLVTASKMDAKAASLKPDEDGSISLTKTQLQEFFGV